MTLSHWFIYIFSQRLPEVYTQCDNLACVASVPVRSERNSGRAKESFGPREKWRESKKVEERGWARGKKGTLARKPLDLEKRPLVFTVEFIY